MKHAVAEPKDYFYCLSAIRGVAALLVVLRHTGGLFTPLTCPMSYMAVDVFFLLSGIVIDAAYQQRLAANLTISRFFWLRMVRIYPLYILGCGVTLLALIVAPHHVLFIDPRYPYTFTHPALLWLCAMLLIPNLFAAKSSIFSYDKPGWSLFFELAVNLFYAAIVNKLTTRRLVMIIAVCGVVMTVYLVLNHGKIIELGWKRQTFLVGFMRAGYSFFMGVLLYRLYQSHKLKFSPFFTAVAPWLVLLAVAALLIASPSHNELYVYLIAVFFVFPAIIYLALHVQPAARFVPLWQFLGDASYAIYALHWPLCVLGLVVLTGVFGVPVIHYAPWSGVMFLAVLLALSWLLDRVYDAPLRRALRWENMSGLGYRINEALKTARTVWR